MAQENQDSKKRAAVGKMTGFIGVLCNLLLAGSKLVIGKLAASTSITADGFHHPISGRSDRPGGASLHRRHPIPGSVL